MSDDDDKLGSGGAPPRPRRASDPTSWRGGDDAAGFQVRLDRGRSLLRLTFWGYWRNEVGFAFRDAMIAAIAEAASLPAWDVLADLTRYPAQNATVQKCHADSMGKAKACPTFRRAANLVDNTLSEMQIRRLSNESGLPLFAFFQDEGKALAWLHQQAQLSP